MLNPENATPLYQQLKEEIKNAINIGHLAPGAKIPTEPELSEQYNVSRITVRRAIEELSQEGYLFKKQGKGTFVKEAKIQRKIGHLISFSKACEANGMVSSTHLISREIISLCHEDALTMGVAPGSQALSIQRIRYADNIPIMCENNLFPYPKYAFLLSEPLESPLYNLLDEKYNINVTSSLNSFIDVVRSSGDLSKKLNICNGEPLFYLYCQMYDSTNQLVHIGKQYIISDRYRFYLEDYS